MNSQTLIDLFSEKLRDNEGAMFVGSGLSTPSNLPTWKQLLEDFARTRLGVELTDYDNLPLVAQYIVNSSGGNRGPLVGEITRRVATVRNTNDYHRALTWTNVPTLWTTNYDTLLEQAFGGFDVEIKSTDASITRTIRRHQIEIIKMHGCIATSSPDDLVITQEDYDDFFVKRPAIAQRLGTDLLGKSFLFIGYSYQDPNINNIVVGARRLAKGATRQHFMVLKREQSQLMAKRQTLWCDHLKRFGIDCVLIDNFEELSSMLFAIARKSRGPSIFVTGSHQDNSQLANDLGQALARLPVLLLDGQSEGVSHMAVSAYTSECIQNRSDIHKRIRVFPNPYAANPDFANRKALIPTLKQWRASLLRSAQVVVVFDGGMGTQAEVEVAKEMGCYLIPVPSGPTGLARELVSQPEVQSFLQRCAPAYLAKVTGGEQITLEDVVTCIKTAMDI